MLDDTAPAAARALFSVHNIGNNLEEAACEKNKRKATKAYLAALLRKVHRVTIQSSKSKPEHIKCLAKEIGNDVGTELQGYMYYDSLPAAAAAGDGDHDDQIESEEEGDDDGPDYGEVYYKKRVAKYHT